MKIKEEKELKQMLARQFNTRPDKIEITKTETDSENGRITHVKFKGYPYRIDSNNGRVSAVYRII